MSDTAALGGPVIPADVGGLDAVARELDLLAGAVRHAATRQADHLRALHGWTGRGHQAWVASTERTGRAALAIAVMLGNVTGVLRYLCRAVSELRWRAGALAARAAFAGFDIGPDATMRRLVLLPAPPPGTPPAVPPRRVAGPEPRPPFSAVVEGHGLAAQADPWRTLQLDVAALVDDACTTFAAARFGLRRIVDDQHRASTVPRSARLPDGGGYPISALAAAAAAVQLPQAQEDLWELVHRRAGDGAAVPVAPERGGRPRTLPEEVARVVAERRLGREARMNAAARALDRIVAAAGQVPVVAAASVPVGRIPPLRPVGVLGKLPVADMALAGWSVRQDLANGYSVPEAVAREGASTLAGCAAAEGAGSLVVVLGGPPVAAAIVAVGAGLLVGQLVGSLFDKVVHHDR